MEGIYKRLLFLPILLMVCFSSTGCTKTETISEGISKEVEVRTEYCKYISSFIGEYYYDGIKNYDDSKIIGRVISDQEGQFVGTFQDLNGDITLITGNANHIFYQDKYIEGKIKNQLFKDRVKLYYTEEYRKSYIGMVNAEYQEHGVGDLILSNGICVDVEYDNGTLINAVYEDKNGNRYEGKLNEEYVLEGKGSIQYTDGSRYTGDVVAGYPSGEGKLVYSDSDYYVGEFDNGEKDGDGCYYHKDGTVFDGEWSEGELTYAHKIEYIDGSSYSGPIKNGKRDGYGTITYKNQDVYRGYWEEDLYDGTGKYTFANGAYYDGYWEEGKLDGYVTYVNRSGTKYTGRWENGRCTYIYSVN